MERKRKYKESKEDLEKTKKGPKKKVIEIFARRESLIFMTARFRGQEEKF